MKLVIVFSVACLFCLETNGLQWQNLRSPLESPRYQEILRNIYRDLPIPSDEPIRGGRVTNGDLAILGQFPFQVYMYLTVPFNQFLCGGSLIHKRWVLTAGHCLDKVTDIAVYLGATNRYDDGREGSYIKRIDVNSKFDIYRHPNYNEQIISNDIGLVKLSEDAPLDHPYMDVVRIPPVNFPSTDGEIGTVAGFGRYLDSFAGASDELRFVRLPIVSVSFCQAVFGDRYVTAKNVCLQNVNNAGVCQGDSGGPLTVTAEDGTLVQVGVVSFGHAAGCEVGFPDVFTRVSSHVPWIELVTGITF